MGSTNDRSGGRGEAEGIFATLPGHSTWQGLKAAQGFPALVEGEETTPETGVPGMMEVGRW